MIIALRLVCALVPLFLVAPIFCLLTAFSGNQSFRLRLKREVKKADSVDPKERLVYSTKTQLQVLSSEWTGADDKTAKHFTTLMEEQSYVINSFDVSFQEGLAFFGIDELFARPIGMSVNYLQIDSKKNMNIKYEGQFAVDWLDHNVLIFRDRAIHIVSLLYPHYTREIYNGSKEVRNIVVSSKSFFFAWIENDNNIRKMSKDILQSPIVHTEKSKIFCMTLDERAKRFFFYIGGLGFTLQRSAGGDGDGGGSSVDVDQEQRTKSDKKAKNKANNKRTSTPKPDKEYYFVLYSKDFDGRYTPEREGSIRVKGVKSEPVQVAKYRGAIFVILQEETKDNNGDFVYRLGQVMRTGEFKEIVENPNWRITSVKAIGYLNETDLCGKDQNRCSHLCVHANEVQARCLCRDDAPGCTDHPMTVPPGERTFTVPAAVQRHKSYVVAALTVVLLPVVGLLAYCLYGHYLSGGELKDGSPSTASGTLSAASAIVGSSIGGIGAEGGGGDLKQQQQQPSGGVIQALVSWAGLGSADVSSSLLEGEDGDLNQKNQSIGPSSIKNSPLSSVVAAALELPTEVSEVATEPKKRKKKHKHRKKRHR